MDHSAPGPSYSSDSCLSKSVEASIIMLTQMDPNESLREYGSSALTALLRLQYSLKAREKHVKAAEDPGTELSTKLVVAVDTVMADLKGLMAQIGRDEGLVECSGKSAKMEDPTTLEAQETSTIIQSEETSSATLPHTIEKSVSDILSPTQGLASSPNPLDSSLIGHPLASHSNDKNATRQELPIDYQSTLEDKENRILELEEKVSTLNDQLLDRQALFEVGVAAGLRYMENQKQDLMFRRGKGPKNDIDQMVIEKGNCAVHQVNIARGWVSL